MSICPKNKSSKGRRDRRRANWKMSAPTLENAANVANLWFHTEYANPVVLTIKKRSSQLTNQQNMQ